MTILYADGKAIMEIPDEDDFLYSIHEKPNCRTCGAPLIEGEAECEFCGTKRKLKREEQ